MAPVLATDPPKSEAQRRLMEGVAHNPKFAKKVGIPQSVGEEYVGDAMPAAGIMFTTPEGLALFVKRAASSDHAGEWAWPGGGVEDGESEQEAARREALEEVGYEAAQELEELDHQADDQVSFKTFHQRVDQPFLPRLNDEHSAFAWVPVIDPPQPLHPGVASTLEKLANEDDEPLGQDAAFAFDRASVRRTDKDGRLHLETTNISKANVCPYLGREIPGWYELGLDPNKIYKLYRDKDELAKAAPTFNNLPVLSEHVETNAENHKHKLVIGTTGTDADFTHPYLRNSMSFWDKSAIDDIENEDKKELSSAYRYRADMTPGTSPEGERYDGVMRDIIGNHVALVEEGRAGPDVVVGDSKRKLNMKVSQKAVMVRGALASFIAPRLAADAKMPPLATILLGIDAKNFKEKRKPLEDAVTKLLKGKLAKDASVEGLTQLLDGLEKAPVADDMDPEEDMVLDAEEDPADPGVVKVEKPDPLAAIMQLLEGKLTPEDMEQVKALCNQGGAQDDPLPFKGMPEKSGKMAGEEPKAEDEENDTVDKAAMDAALEKSRKETLEAANKNFRAIREAERAVAPYVGEIATAFDSADEIYKHTLKALNVDIEGVHPSAYPKMLKQVPVPGAKKAVVEETLGMDAAAAADFDKRFPSAARIRHV